jgi:hypothetical protein
MLTQQLFSRHTLNGSNGQTSGAAAACISVPVITPFIINLDLGETTNPLALQIWSRVSRKNAALETRELFPGHP